VAWHRKDYEKAEAVFTRSLTDDPGQGQVSYWLSSVILAQRKPEKYSAALFDMARASVFDGPGSLGAEGRRKAAEAFNTSYATYHGSTEGAEQVLTLAKRWALPPADFRIVSKAEILKRQMEKDAESEKANPQLALWKSIRAALEGPQAQNYFSAHMKDAELPEFRGRLVEARPEVRPRELVLAVGGATPDATLVLSEPLAGKMQSGVELSFRGVPRSYTTGPFMVRFDVEKSKVSGWKGTASKAKPGARKRTTRTKKTAARNGSG
jgi:hypothetical protein